MKENMPKSPTPEEQARDEEDQYKACMEKHPETKAPPDALRECETEIAEFENMITAFESEHSLEDLHAIIDLTPTDAPLNPIREPARKALEPIVAKLKALKNETTITDEKYAELKAMYKRLSKAVGIINNDKIDHDR